MSENEIRVTSGLVEIPVSNHAMFSFRCKGKMLKDQCRLNIYVKSTHGMFSATLQGPNSKKCAHIKNVGVIELTWWINRRVCFSNQKQFELLRKKLRAVCS